MPTTRNPNGPTLNQGLIIIVSGVVLAAGSCYTFLEGFHPLAALAFFLGVVVAIVGLVRLLLYWNKISKEREEGKGNTP